MRIRLRCALEELLGRTLKAQPLIAFQQFTLVIGRKSFASTVGFIPQALALARPKLESVLKLLHVWVDFTTTTPRKGYTFLIFTPIFYCSYCK
jgi:hypothetical protein